MAITAFGAAMMDHVQHCAPGDLTVNGTILPGYCARYTQARPDEMDRLRDLMAAAPECVRILDVGCGVGRHIAQALALRREARVTGIERCDLLRCHCARRFTEASFVPDFAALDGAGKFDLILLLGNGLGILGGSAYSVATGLAGLLARLSGHGVLLVESADACDPSGFQFMPLEITHKGLIDTYDWGFASPGWMRANVPAGWRLDSHRSLMPGGCGFFHEIRADVAAAKAPIHPSMPAR